MNMHVSHSALEKKTCSRTTLQPVNLDKELEQNGRRHRGSALLAVPASTIHDQPQNRANGGGGFTEARAAAEARLDDEGGRGGEA